jgi:hypothetical protein
MEYLLDLIVSIIENLKLSMNINKIEWVVLQVTIKFFKNKHFSKCKNKGKFIVFQKLVCNLQ